MSRPVKAMAGEHPVEAAIREGKIPHSRREHYMALMAKKPKKTTRLLASLEPVLEPPEEMEGVRQYVESDGNQTAPAGPRAQRGPTEYDPSWLRPGEVRKSGGHITFEDPASVYGGVSPGMHGEPGEIS